MQKTNVKLVILALVMFLVTTGLLAWTIKTHQATYSYTGHISLSNQTEYREFLDALFLTNVIAIGEVNGKPLPISKSELWDYSPFPTNIGFIISTGEVNPLNSTNAIYYYGYERTRNKLFEYIPSLVIAMIGYGLALGLWIGKNGIYEVKHEVVSSNRRLQQQG